VFNKASHLPAKGPKFNVKHNYNVHHIENFKDVFNPLICTVPYHIPDLMG
jgi:hypothetical protein